MSDADVPPIADRTNAPGRRRWPWLALGGLSLLLVLPIALDLLVSLSAGRVVTGRIDDLEPAPVALILGTSRWVRGGPNLFYHARIQAAAELFHSGKVRGVLVSGDNGSIYYNEPEAMRRDLVALGVPDRFITLDYAGFRTLDSVVRAKEVFGLDRVIIVSQRFHAERAVFLARHLGLEATGLAAADPETFGRVRVRAREVLARSAAVLDLVIGRGPRFLGEPETVKLRASEPTPPSSSA